MKRGFISILFSMIAGTAFACNVCGGSSSNQSLGLLPLSEKHFAGLYSQFRYYTSQHEDHEAAGTGDGTSVEQYFTIQAFGRYSLSTRWQVYAFIPYHINNTTLDGGNEDVRGIGDITMMTTYQLITKDDCGPVLKHNLQIGGGIKAPTGSYSPTSTAEATTTSMQAGTNSWDFTGSANYSLRKGKAGINIEVAYVLTTPNSISYKYGNKFNAALLGFVSLEKDKYVLLPMGGLRFESTAEDYENYRKGWINHSSGGNVTYGTFGFQTFIKDIALMATYSVPLSQNIAGGAVTVKYKAEAAIQYLF